MFLCCYLALAGLGITVCAGPRSCRQAVLWSLDGQRWPAEADGEKKLKATLYDKLLKTDHQKSNYSFTRLVSAAHV